MKLVVLGSTGVLGRNVLPRLCERGHQVRAVARRPEQIQPLERMGMEAVLGDILNPDTLTGATAGCDVVLHLATAIPRAGRPQDWNLNDRIRREGTRNLLAACQSNGIRHYVQQSITLLYGDCGNQIVDETQALHPIPLVESAFDMETMVQASSTEWCILRAGLLYGPGTWREETWRQEAHAGQLSLYGQGDAYMSSSTWQIWPGLLFRQSNRPPPTVSTMWSTTCRLPSRLSIAILPPRLVPSHHPAEANPICSHWAAATARSMRNWAGNPPTPPFNPDWPCNASYPA